MVLSLSRFLGLFIVTAILFMPAVLAEENDCLYYFYGKDCAGCGEVSQQLGLLQEKYPRLTIKQFEVYLDRANEKILDKYFAAYHVARASRGVPVVFTSETYFLGAESIANSLEGRILANKDRSCPSLEQGNAIGLVGGAKSSYHVLETLNIFELAGAGLSDGFRTGMIGVLAILVMLLMVVRNPKHGVQQGVMFLGVLFVVYFLFNFGLFAWFASSAYYTFFTKTVGVIAVGFSLVKLKLYFAKQPLLLSEESISEQTRGRMDFIADLPRSMQGVLAISFLAAILSVGKMGEIHSVLRSFSIDSVARYSVIHLILFYLILVVLPGVLLVVAYHLGKKHIEEHALKKEPASDLNIERQRRTNQRLFNFVSSSLLLLLGLILIIA